jgi:alanine racemase
MIDSSQRAWATIDLHALKKNLSQANIHCPESQIIPVIKANAYGHGVEQVAQALNAAHTKLGAFAVASLEEAMELRTLGLDTPILLLSGFRNREEMELCLNHSIEPVVHSSYQFDELARYLQNEILFGVGRIWVKFNSGMNRLGLSKEEALQVYADLHKHPETEVVLMSHLASADEIEDSSAVDFTNRQIAEFDSLKEQIAHSTQGPVNATLAASAAILELPQTHQQFVRPGIMLYGGSPFRNRTSAELGLLPVMTLRSRLLAVNTVKAGASIGYGATYTCEQDTRVGVVSIGYADGYPRSAKNGTPVLIKSASGVKRSQLLGRVSMDMITVDLSDIDDAQPGDEVVLWGDGLAADEVAHCADTISYELFCRVTKRVSFVYTDE